MLFLQKLPRPLFQHYVNDSSSSVPKLHSCGQETARNFINYSFKKVDFQFSRTLLFMYAIINILYNSTLEPNFQNKHHPRGKGINKKTVHLLTLLINVPCCCCFGALHYLSGLVVFYNIKSFTSQNCKFVHPV